MKQKEHAPPIHNLLRLAKLAEVEVPDEKIDTLIEISAFNIEARYPDLKRAFREKCNADYAGNQILRKKEIFQWLQEIK